jgi:ornithine cyclodeaminase
MRYLSNADVAALVGPGDALDAVRRAFAELGEGTGAVHGRERTDVGTAKLSTLGAVLTDAGVLGAKVYSTVSGRFTFLLVLFAADDGRRLAVLESDELTRLRTAATSMLATQHLGRADIRRLVVFGRGVQARGHVEAFTAAYGDLAVTLVSRESSPDEVGAALGSADVVVTATRSTTPLFSGRELPAGVHVCAVGTSRADARELDDDTYRGAATVAVEWLPQARREAGGLVSAVEAGALAWDDVVELADVVVGRHPGRRDDREVTVFQSVGIGIEDVALAAVAWSRAETDDRGTVLA